MLNDIYQNLDPVLFSLGPLAVRWYGLAFAIGFTVGYSIVRVCSATRGRLRNGWAFC